MSILDKYRSITLEPVDDVAVAPARMPREQKESAHNLCCPICSYVGARGVIVRSVCTDCDRALFPGWLFAHDYDEEVRLRGIRSNTK